MAGTCGQDARSQDPQVSAVWVAVTTSPTRRPTKEMEGCDQERPEGAEDEWYEEAGSRAGWRAMCRLGMEELAETRQSQRQRAAATRDVECEVCGRKFRRESDRKRHKCVDERRKPVSQQKGAVQCGSCRRWFRSRGGLAVHVCSRPGS